MAEPVRITVTADTATAAANVNDLARAVQTSEERMDAAGRSSAAWADKADYAGAAAAKFAGGIGDVADGLAANGVISEEAAEQADKVAKGFMVVAGAADIAVTASALLTAAHNAGGIAAARNAVANASGRAVALAGAAATGVATAAQWAWNVALSANPIGLIIIAIVALVAAFVLLWKNSETFRNIVIGVWNAIKAGAEYVFNFLKSYFVTMWNFYKSVFQAGINAVLAVWDGIKAVYDKVVGIFTKVIDFYRGLISKFLDVGRSIMRGLADGISEGLKWVKEKVTGLGSLLPDWLESLLGIKSPSTVFAEIGRMSALGLAQGLDAGQSKVQKAVDGIGGTLTSLAPGGTIDIAASGSASGTAGRSGAAPVINLTIMPGAGDYATGKAVRDALHEFYRVGGAAA